MGIILWVLIVSALVILLDFAGDGFLLESENYTLRRIALVAATPASLLVLLTVAIQEWLGEGSAAEEWEAYREAWVDTWNG